VDDSVRGVRDNGRLFRRRASNATHGAHGVRSLAERRTIRRHRGLPIEPRIGDRRTDDTTRSSDVARGVITTRFVAFVAALGLAQAACDWPWRHDMADQPSRPAGAGPRSPAAGSVPIDGSLQLRPDVAERRLQNRASAPPAIDAGRQRYVTYCAPCHGLSGRGDGPVAREFEPPMG